MKMTVPLACVAFGLLTASTLTSLADEQHPTTAPSHPSAHADAKESAVPPVLQFKTKSLSGQEVDLSKYQGKVVLFVNSASKCGYTPQYKDLEALHEKYKDKGLAILAFPSGDFKEQEFKTAEETAAFCEKNYGVTFDLFEKSHVKGEEQTALFKYLTSEATSPYPGEIKWNFEKFLVGRDGKIIARYRSAVKPSSDEVVTAIESALGK